MTAMSGLRRPLGLFLQGGGALGAWQAGAVEAFLDAGLEFDAIMGFSIGSLNAAALALGRMREGLQQWRRTGWTVIKPQVRLSPFSLFDPAPLRDFLGPSASDDGHKAALKVPLSIIVGCPAESRTLNARFTPGGAGVWDAPLTDYVAASCSIPGVFPPVDAVYRGRPVRLIDGGIPVGGPLDLSPLAHCADVLVLEMFREEEFSRSAWTPFGRLDLRSRRDVRRLTNEGVAGLRAMPDAPRVHRLEPSSRLVPKILDFRNGGLLALMAQGAADARAFLASTPALASRTTA